jgi:hypothetical protein
MNFKSLVLSGLVLAGLSVGAIHAQYSKMPSDGKAPTLGSGLSPADAGTTALVPTAREAGAVPALSSWITNCANGCQFPLGGDGGIRYELYLRNGLSFPIGGSFFGHTLQDGWIIQGGGRTLFFNEEGDAAWTVDVGLTNIYNNGQHFESTVILHNEVRNLTQTDFTGRHVAALIPSLPVSTQELNRTFFDLGFGREIYLAGPPQADSWNWRAGFDVGGRYGTAKLNLHDRFDLLSPPRTDIFAGGHRSDTIGGIFVALHSDLEIPYGCIVLLAGLRLEWDYTWMDILQSQNNGDVQEINLLFNAGLRF